MFSISKIIDLKTLLCFCLTTITICDNYHWEPYLLSRDNLSRVIGIRLTSSLIHRCYGEEKVPKTRWSISIKVTNEKTVRMLANWFTTWKRYVQVRNFYRQMAVIEWTHVYTYWSVVVHYSLFLLYKYW